MTTTQPDPRPGPWIISKDWRRCARCYGPAKVTTGGADGRDISTTCKNAECGDTNAGRADERKESRACRHCGFVFRTVVGYPRQGSLITELRFEDTCLACRYERRFIHYTALANDFAQRARKIRAARRTQAQEPTS